MTFFLETFSTVAVFLMIIVIYDRFTAWRDKLYIEQNQQPAPDSGLEARVKFLETELEKLEVKLNNLQWRQALGRGSVVPGPSKP